jgi:hypothetical protein
MELTGGPLRGAQPRMRDVRVERRVRRHLALTRAWRSVQLKERAARYLAGPCQVSREISHLPSSCRSKTTIQRSLVVTGQRDEQTKDWL